MNIESSKFSDFAYVEHALLILSFLILFSTVGSLQGEAIALNGNPPIIKHPHLPYRTQYASGDLTDRGFHQKAPAFLKKPAVINDKIFQIEASDAIDDLKYSQPAVDYHQLSSFPNVKVPLSSFLRNRIFQIPSPLRNSEKIQEQASTDEVTKKSSSKPMRNIRYLDPVPDKIPHLSEAVVGSDYKRDGDFDVVLSDMSFNGEPSNFYKEDKNNFTDAGENLLSISSDAVLSYEHPVNFDNFSKDVVVDKQSPGQIEEDVPSLNPGTKTSEKSSYNLSTHLPILKTVLPGFTTQTSVVFNTHMYIEFVNQTNSSLSGVTTLTLPSIHTDGNISTVLPSLDNETDKLSSGTVAGIVIAVLVCITLLSSAVIYLLYRKYNGKCTSVVESKFNSDNCGYLDDSLRSSIYLNNHIELPKESSEEMTSLDNDSFLNSLETMTIQNYWADNSKNTKV